MVKPLIVAIAIAAPGCSWIIMNNPSARTPAGQPDCDDSYAWPMTDAAVATSMIAAGGALSVLCHRESRPYRGGGAALCIAWLAGGTVWSLPIWAASITGFVKRSRCKAVIEEPARPASSAKTERAKAERRTTMEERGRGHVQACPARPSGPRSSAAGFSVIGFSVIGQRAPGTLQRSSQLASLLAAPESGGRNLPASEAATV